MNLSRLSRANALQRSCQPHACTQAMRAALSVSDAMPARLPLPRLKTWTLVSRQAAWGRSSTTPPTNSRSPRMTRRAVSARWPAPRTHSPAMRPRGASPASSARIAKVKGRVLPHRGEAPSLKASLTTVVTPTTSQTRCDRWRSTRPRSMTASGAAAVAAVGPSPCSSSSSTCATWTCPASRACPSRSTCPCPAQRCG